MKIQKHIWNNAEWILTKLYKMWFLFTGKSSAADKQIMRCGSYNCSHYCKHCWLLMDELQVPSDAHITGQDEPPWETTLCSPSALHFTSLHFTGTVKLLYTLHLMIYLAVTPPPLPSISHAGTTMGKDKTKSHGECILGPRCSRQYAGKGQKEGILMV